MRNRLTSWGLAVLLAFASIGSASALENFTLSGGLGAVYDSNAAKMDFALGLGFEYKLDPFFGIGAFGNHVFATPSYTLLGLPEFFVHPLGGDWYIAASPVVLFGSGRDTKWGTHLGTRIPLILGFMSLIPQASVDFIGGDQIWSFGLGIAI